MGSSKTQLAFVMDQIASAGMVSAKAMFGEYGIYCDGKICALLCDNQLFIKPTDAGRAFIGKPVEAPPYPGAKPYFLVDDKIDNRRWLSELIRVTADSLPEPKPKRSAKSQSKTKSEPTRATRSALKKKPLRKPSAKKRNSRSGNP